MRPSRLSSKAAPVVGSCTKTSLYSIEGLEGSIVRAEGRGKSDVKDGGGQRRLLERDSQGRPRRRGRTLPLLFEAQRLADKSLLSKDGLWYHSSEGSDFAAMLDARVPTRKRRLRPIARQTSSASKDNRPSWA